MSLGRRNRLQPTHQVSIVRLLVCIYLISATTANAQRVYNLTGLPLYPNLTSAQMDSVTKTDALGHWCMRFAAETFASLDTVEDWYRKALPGASETDLNHDERYHGYLNLSGIKLAFDIDSVTVFRAANQSHTSIELFKVTQKFQVMPRDKRSGSPWLALIRSYSRRIPITDNLACNPAPYAKRALV